MSFIMDLIMKEGMKYVPSAIEKIESSLKDDEAILIVPAKGRLVLCVGQFAPRVSDVNEETRIYTINTASDVKCKRFLIPDELDKMIQEFNG